MKILGSKDHLQLLSELVIISLIIGKAEAVANFVMRSRIFTVCFGDQSCFEPEGHVCGLVLAIPVNLVTTQKLT